MPPLIRRRSLLRALSYMLDLALTLGAKAVWEIWSAFATDLPSTNGVDSLSKNGVDILTSNLIALNGSSNVLTYIFWVWRRERLERGTERGDVMSLEALAIERYFDLYA